MFQSTTDEHTTRGFTVLASAVRRGTPARISWRLTAPAFALALAVLITGNAAAVQLARDDNNNARLVTPMLETRIVSSQQLKLKLATKAGHSILVFG
jgi:hypothetical protein